jgi:hypothetical protein
MRVFEIEMCEDFLRRFCSQQCRKNGLVCCEKSGSGRIFFLPAAKKNSKGVVSLKKIVFLPPEINIYKPEWTTITRKATNDKTGKMSCCNPLGQKLWIWRTAYANLLEHQSIFAHA